VRTIGDDGAGRDEGVFREGHAWGIWIVPASLCMNRLSRAGGDQDRGYKSGKGCQDFG
jgi:hypothetical protein